MGVFHFSTIYNYWRTDGIVLITLIIVKKITRDRYVLLRKYIHYLDLTQEGFITIGTGRWKQLVWYKKLLLFASEIRKN